MATNYADHYRTLLEAGQRYQDFVALRLYQEGIVLVGFQSREYQYKVGENALGLEIKFDDKFGKTGNFWIECAEKTHPSNPAWIPSGIHRGDRSWLYGIGNYDEFWIFAVKTLQDWQANHEPKLIENGTKTSRGFLLPRHVASPLSARQFAWNLENPLVLLRHEGREPGEEG